MSKTKLNKQKQTISKIGSPVAIFFSAVNFVNDNAFVYKMFFLLFTFNRKSFRIVNYYYIERLC